VEGEFVLDYFGVDAFVEPAVVEEDIAHHLDGLDEEVVLSDDFLQGGLRGGGGVQGLEEGGVA
jgi:hypothetical protein